MKIDTQVQDDHQAKLTVSVELSELDEYKQRAAAKIAKKVKVPGFRPGKAPYAIVERQVGVPAIMEEALEIYVQQNYPKIIEESGIKPFTSGSLENMTAGDPITLEFLVPLEPEVTLGDYQSIRQAYDPKAVSEEEIDAVLADMRERQAVVEPVERPAELGDQVMVKLSGERQNVAEDENPTLIRERVVPVIVRSADELAEDNWPFPGFSQHLIGMSAGDEKSVEYTWPEDSDTEQLRGASATFELAVEAVKSRTLPELNDEFVTTLGGDFDTLEAMRGNVREYLENEARTTFQKDYDSAILDQATEISEFRIPRQMIEHEIDGVLHDLGHRLEQQNMDLELYKKMRGMDDAGLREEMRPTAEKRIQRGLFLAEFGKSEELTITPEELQREAEHTFAYLAQTLPPKDAKKLGNRDVSQNVVQNLLSEMMSERAMNRLRFIASEGLAGNEPEAEAELDDDDSVTLTLQDPDAEAAEGEEASPAETAAELDDNDSVTLTLQNPDAEAAEGEEAPPAETAAD